MDLQYVYQPLDESTQEIRVLDVQPLPDRVCDVLKCKIRHVSLKDDPKPRYETISYCWGDPSPSSQIRVDGRLLPVPVETERALRRMALPDQCRTLWIDAVSINQKDNLEREEQVWLMGDVFFRSDLNLIYLGEEDSTTAAAIANIESLVQEAKEAVGSLEKIADELFPSGVPKHPSSPRQMQLDVSALFTFFARPWFRYGVWHPTRSRSHADGL